MNTAIKLSVLVLGLFGVACSSTPNNGASSASAASTSNHFRSGIITINQTMRSDGNNGMLPHYQAIATFVDIAPSKAKSSAPAADPCTHKMIGLCSVTACGIVPATAQDASEPVAADDSAPAKMPTAGAISISAGHKVTLASNKHGLYAPKIGDKEFFGTSNTVAIHAKGGDVPAFDKVLNMPPRITLSTPAWPAEGTSFALNRANGIDLAWTGGGTGHVVTTIMTKTDSKSVEVACRFDAVKGHATIPATALAKLVSGATGTFTVDTRSASTLQAGDWSVTTIANSPAITANGVAQAIATVN